MSEILQRQTRHVIFDSIVEGVCTVDENWSITSFNRAAEEITGVSSDDAIGRRCCDVFHESICQDECALVHRQASIDGLVVTAFMRSRLKAAPMNRGTTNHPTCHSKIDEALAPMRKGKL